MRIGSVEFEQQGRVAIVTLDEPTKLNAISMGIREGVIESLARIQADDEIRVGILTGRGDKAFCAGADISTFPATPEQARSFIADVLPVLEAGGWAVHVPHDLTWALEHAEAPVHHPRFFHAADLGALPGIIDAIERM